MSGSNSYEYTSDDPGAQGDDYECEFCGNTHGDGTDCPYVEGCEFDSDVRGPDTAFGITQRYNLEDFETGMSGLDPEDWNTLMLGRDYIEVEEGDLPYLKERGWGHLEVGDKVNVQMPEELWQIYVDIGAEQGRERVVANEDYLDVETYLPEPMWFTDQYARHNFVNYVEGRSYYLKWVDGSVYLMWRAIGSEGEENDVRSAAYYDK